MAQKPRRKLDKSRDYGQISPPFHGAVYNQDGVNFDARGLEIFTDEDVSIGEQHKSISYWDTREAQAAKMRASKASKQADDDGDAPDLPDQDATDVTEAPDEDDDDHTTPAGSDEIDLVKWAKGQETHPWFAVRKALLEKYHFEATNKNAALEKLMDLSLIGPEDIGR